mgnify:CR=1 FL=1
MERKFRRRFVLLDRDGVININRDDYVKSVEEVKFIPGALEALSRLNAAGWNVVVISNQACVGRGIISEETLQTITHKMEEEITRAGGEIAAVYYCMHRPEDGCDCRKPAPGLIERAGRELGFDPNEAVFIGDAEADIKAGKAAGCRTVLVLSGRISKTEAEQMEPAPDCIADDLAEAVDLLNAGW